MKYITNGINEKRIEINDKIPDGWYYGRVKSSVTTKDCMFINNGINEKFINKYAEIPEGWTKGRLYRKHQKKRKKIIYYNNGIIQKGFYAEDIIPDGWKKGKLPLSEAHKRACSKGHLGKHVTEETKRKISLHSNNNRKKANETITQKYGSLDSYYKQIYNKGIETKYKKWTINTSQVEKEYLKQLRKVYGYPDVMTQYRSEKYPFRCDFYIRSLDLYIELNAHWTHGGMPYDKNNPECQKKLELWKEKAKTSKFYENAIYTWTVRDVEKQKIAKENNLNYKVIY